MVEIRIVKNVWSHWPAYFGSKVIAKSGNRIIEKLSTNVVYVVYSQDFETIYLKLKKC